MNLSIFDLRFWSASQFRSASSALVPLNQVCTKSFRRWNAAVPAQRASPT
jgi:hypothetical protein